MVENRMNVFERMIVNAANLTIAELDWVRIKQNDSAMSWTKTIDAWFKNCDQCIDNRMITNGGEKWDVTGRTAMWSR